MYTYYVQGSTTTGHMYTYFCRGQPPRSAVRTYLVHRGRSGVGRVGAPAIVGHIWICGCMCEQKTWCIAVMTQRRLTSLSKQ